MKNQENLLRIHAIVPSIGFTAEQRNGRPGNFMVQSVQRDVRFPIPGYLSWICGGENRRIEKDLCHRSMCLHHCSTTKQWMLVFCGPICAQESHIAYFRSFKQSLF